MTNPTILLLDNGSCRADASLNLRRLAAGLSDSAGMRVDPVSLQHADRIPVQALGGTAADTFVPFMERRLSLGERNFLILPLFFGPSRALSHFLPEQADRLRAVYGEFELRQGPVLCPLPEGEPKLARILCDLLPSTDDGSSARRVVLVDHGSPSAEVTAVRSYLAGEMRRILGTDIELREAAMERREGRAYDFNGETLETVLARMAEEVQHTPVALSQLFISPGRHAGKGGDIEEICRRLTRRYRGFRILASSLMGEHPGLLSILRDRLQTGLDTSP